MLVVRKMVLELAYCAGFKRSIWGSSPRVHCVRSNPLGGSGSSPARYVPCPNCWPRSLTLKRTVPSMARIALILIRSSPKLSTCVVSCWGTVSGPSGNAISSSLIGRIAASGRFRNGWGTVPCPQRHPLIPNSPRRDQHTLGRCRLGYFDQGVVVVIEADTRRFFRVDEFEAADAFPLERAPAAGTGNKAGAGRQCI